MSNRIVLECKRLHKNYPQAGGQLQILTDINFALQAGSSVAITGASGSGKSTFLHLLAGLDRPSAGEVVLAGQAISGLSEKLLGRARNKNIGFIYQFHHLLHEFSAIENVALPLLVDGRTVAEARECSLEILYAVGLKARVHHRPAQLSGGERQRVAVARAMVMHPSCLLADEPTGNLDNATAQEVFALMRRLQEERGNSLLIATHDVAFANRLERRFSLVDGKLLPH